MPIRSRLPWALRASVRLLARPIRKPGLPRLVYVAVTGSPRTLRAKARAVRLLNKMYRNHGLVRAEADTLIQLLNTHPSVVWSSKIPIIWKDTGHTVHIYWWHTPKEDTDATA